MSIGSNVVIIAPDDYLFELWLDAVDQIKEWITSLFGPEYERWEFISVLVNMETDPTVLHVPTQYPAIKFYNGKDQTFFTLAHGNKIVYNYNWAVICKDNEDWL